MIGICRQGVLFHIAHIERQLNIQGVMFTDKGGNVQRRRCEGNRGNHDSSLSGFVNVPNVQETLVGSGSDVEFGAAGGTIQS